MNMLKVGSLLVLLMAVTVMAWNNECKEKAVGESCTTKNSEDGTCQTSTCFIFWFIPVSCKKCAPNPTTTTAAGPLTCPRANLGVDLDIVDDMDICVRCSAQPCPEDEEFTIGCLGSNLEPVFKFKCTGGKFILSAITCETPE